MMEPEMRKGKVRGMSKRKGSIGEGIIRDDIYDARSKVYISESIAGE